MTPALRALARRCRTIAYSLCGDIGSGAAFDSALGFDNYIRQIDQVLLKAGIQTAAICGVSYGGFIALRYAALRPMRATALILASSPAPGWVPNPTQRSYVAHPWRSAPAFVATAPLRLWPEIKAACPAVKDRLAFALSYSARVLASPAVPSRMAARIRLQQRLDFAPDCGRIAVPTLVLTGEDGLDRIVPPDVTRRYQSLIRGAQYEKIENTGHLGLLTRPERFADIVSGFVNQCHPSRI